MRLLSAAAAAALALGCGDDGAAAPDAGAQPTYQLEVLSPPGESIGLGFAGRATLRVRYLDELAQPIAGAELRFSLLATGSESSGGSTLSAESAVTDELGIARIELVAGAERVNFRVEVRAPAARSALFYVAVSEGGFTSLAVTPRHEGSRDAGAADTLQVRLHRAVDLRCVDADPEALPESVFPPRALPGYDEPAVFRNVSAGESYTLVAWAESATGGILGFGCVDLGAAQVRSGLGLALDVAVVDRPAAIAEPLALSIPIDATALAPELPGAALWEALACPLGPAQLAIDCALDAQVPDGALDCLVGGDGPLIADVEAARAELGADGCRADAALERALTDAMTFAGDDLAAARQELLATLSLDSELSASAAGFVRHRLVFASAGASGDAYGEILAATPRPVLVADGIPLAVTADGTFELGRHGFTLRAGDFLAAAFDALALAPANLEADSLGTALVASIDDGAQPGCPALDAIVCPAASRPTGCLSNCTQIPAALDEALAAWPTGLSGTGLDLHLSATGTAVDDDLDLHIDTLEATWTAELTPDP